MTHINYQNLKRRMCFANKGFWKVQSIHKLSTKLQLRYNPKYFIALKLIKRHLPKIPPFISFQHQEKFPKKNKNLKNHKSLSCENFTSTNFFITNDFKNSRKIEKEEKTKSIFNKLYGKFVYEPYLYNELQFISLEKEKRMLPRKFNEVVKDCLALSEYKKYLNNLKKMKKMRCENEFDNNFSNNIFPINNNNNNTHDTMNNQLNDKKSMTIINKRNIYENEIFKNIYNENKKDDSILNYSKNRVINNKNKYKIMKIRSPILNIRKKINCMVNNDKLKLVKCNSNRSDQ